MNFFFVTALEVAAQDWPSLYEKNFLKFETEYKKSKELEETKIMKQENYIFREQEYRKVIQDLKAQIDSVSQKPLERQRDKSEDQMQMEGINLKIKKNDPNALQTDDAIDEGNQNTAGMTDLRPDPKLVQSLWAD